MSTVQRDVESPYFSPRRKRPRSRSTSPSEGRGKSLRPAVRPDTFPDNEQLAGQDPLYCFYFRTFTLLYKRLEQSKPLLIQGIYIVAFNHVAICMIYNDNRTRCRRPLESSCRCDSPQ
jgi:hypothetical protein